MLQLLGADTAAAAPRKSGGAPAASQATGGPDLLGDLLGGEPAPGPASQAHAGGGDLLGGCYIGTLPHLFHCVVKESPMFRGILTMEGSCVI